jgi:hypothetical protein
MSISTKVASEATLHDASAVNPAPLARVKPFCKGLLFAAAAADGWGFTTPDRKGRIRCICASAIRASTAAPDANKFAHFRSTPRSSTSCLKRFLRTKSPDAPGSVVGAYPIPEGPSCTAPEPSQHWQPRWRCPGAES